MYELLNIEVKDGKQLVSGRELHEFLEISTRYDTWFNRMLEYGFVEGIDFCTILSESTGGRPSTNHALTLDMAKHLSMIQRNDKGMVARSYFIQCEKLTNQLTMYYDEKLVTITNRLDRTEKLIGIRSKTVFNYGKYIKNKMG